MNERLHYHVSTEGYIVDFVLKYHSTRVIGDSGVGKSYVFSDLPRSCQLQGAPVTFYINQFSQEEQVNIFETRKNALFIIDNAGVVRDKYPMQIDYMLHDVNNWYLFLVRGKFRIAPWQQAMCNRQGKVLTLEYRDAEAWDKILGVS